MANEIELKEQFMNTESEAHSFQDGAFIGFISALFVTGSEIISIIGLALGFGTMKIGKKRVLEKATGLVRTGEVLDAPEYFILGFISTFVPTIVAVVATQQIIPVVT